MNSCWYIYSLTDPRTGTVRYVGKTKNVRRRLLQHITEATRKTGSYRLHWIRSLLSSGMTPALSVLETGEGAGWQEAEQRWIASFRAAGAELVNGTAGGEGGALTAEVKKKIGDARRGKPLSAAHRAALSRGWKHRGPMSTETKEKMSASLRGRKHSAEHIAKVAAANRGRKFSAEVCARMSAAHLGKKLPPRSAEWRAKIAAAHRGKGLSAEIRAKISATKRRQWAEKLGRNALIQYDKQTGD